MSASPAERQRPLTATQQLVLDALGSSDHFRSAQHICADIREDRTVRIGLTSVYRILRGLVADGIAEAQRAEDGEVLYRRRSHSGHRHYLLCRRCGRAIAFTPTALEERTGELTARHRFTEVTHHVDLYGVCPRCRGT